MVFSQIFEHLQKCTTLRIIGPLKEKGTGETVTTMVMGKEKDIWEKEKGSARGMDLVLEKEGQADLGLLQLPLGKALVSLLIFRLITDVF